MVTAAGAVGDVVVKGAWLLVAAAMIAGTADGANAQGYVVSVGDELLLDFLDDDAEPYPAKVGWRGEFLAPFIGAVEIAGLPLEAARRHIAALYVENEIFVAPRLELTVVKLRPVSVLGDVRTPGLYDFVPSMTVEQAVGLAGGTFSLSEAEESRALQRANLRGEIRQAVSAVARELAAIARLRAQLEGRDALDSPAEVRAELDHSVEGLYRQLLRREEEMLLAEAENHAKQTELLEHSITESTAELEMVQEQMSLQKARIESYADDLARSLELTARGHQTAPMHARLERQVAEEEATLLRLEARFAQIRREHSALRREYQTMSFQRRQDWRQELVEREVRLAQLLANRAAMSSQFSLLTAWTNQTAAGDRDLVVEYRVRPGAPSGMEARKAEPTDEVQPGDIVLVRTALPTLLSAAPSR